MIDTKKILTISANEYCQIYGKNISDYRECGVHLSKRQVHRENFDLSKEFAKLVPDNTEVVVSYRFSVGGSGPELFQTYASGTALIPKE
jgi:hypothetical protein